MNTIAQYCQKCRTPNAAGEINCRNCGTRLMLLVFPPSMRHEDSIVPSYYEDHLLERVSLLELRLTQMAEQFKNIFDFIREEAKSFQKDHQLLKAFFESLEKLNPVFAEEISKICLDNLNEQIRKSQTENRKEQILQDILEAHGTKQAELFTHLLKEGMRFLEENEEKQAFLNLSRAALLSPENAPLLLFIGENLFRADKFSKVKEFLEKLLKIEPQNEKGLLLFGAISADEGESENARKYLGILAGNPKFAACVNFIWGILAASEANWKESLAAFKESAKTEENAEIFYLIGSVYFQLRQFENALKYFEKATKTDSRFADAWFMQSIVFQHLSELEKAEMFLRNALEAKEAGAQCIEFLRKKNLPELKNALAFLHFGKGGKILSKAAPRLAKFYRQKVLETIL